MAKVPPKEKAGSSGFKVVREANSGRFTEVVQRMRKENTASPDIARSKLKELGILSSDGRLSNKYK